MDDATKTELLDTVKTGVHLVSRMRQTALADSFRDKETEAEGWAANMRSVNHDRKKILLHRHYTVRDDAELSRTLEGEPGLQVSAIPSNSNVTEEEYERFVKQTNFLSSASRLTAEFLAANLETMWPEETEWDKKAAAENSILQYLTISSADKMVRPDGHV